MIGVAQGPAGVLRSVEERLTEALGADPRPVVAGLSGGADSVVLVHAIRQTGRRMIAAHVNYGLRGSDSEDDEAFVRAFCERLDTPCRILAAPPAPSVSVQAWARRVRYDWFEQVAERTGAAAVVIAHHADDQAETVLINLIRGTGLDGLRGMRPERRLGPDRPMRVVRPLLSVRQSDILAYAERHGLDWRNDESNRDERYLRTRVRTWLREEDGALADVGRIASLAERMTSASERLHRSLVSAGAPDPDHRPESGRVEVAGGILGGLPETVAGWYVNRLLSTLDPDAPRNRDVIEEVLRLLSSQPGRTLEIGRITVWRLREGLRFEIAPVEPLERPVEFRLGESVLLPGGRLQSTECSPPDPSTIDLDRGEAIVDADSLSDVLTIRRWRRGDRIQPLGMTGTKKVKDILTDRRVPPPEKSSVLVVESGDDIVWIVGADTDHRFRIRRDTRRAARFKFLVC